MSFPGALALAAALAAVPASDAGAGADAGVPLRWEALRTVEAHTAAVLALALSPDGTRLLTGAADGTARLWDTATGARLLDLPRARSQVQAVAIAPGGGGLAVGEQELAFRLFGPDAGTPSAEVPHPDSVSKLAFSPDGTRLVVSGVAGTAQVYSAATGAKQLAVLGRGVAWTPDGTQLVCAVAGGLVRLVDGTKGAVKKELKTGTHRPMLAGALAGPVAVTYNGDEPLVHLYDLKKGAELPPLKGHEGGVSSVALSADGRRAATASVDRTLRLWDVPSRRMVGHRQLEQLGFVALSADGRTLAVSQGPRVELFRLPP